MHEKNAIPVAIVLAGLWIILTTNSPLDDTWNYVFGVVIGALGLLALVRN